MLTGSEVQTHSSLKALYHYSRKSSFTKHWEKVAFALLTSKNLRDDLDNDHSEQNIKMKGTGVDV